MALVHKEEEILREIVQQRHGRAAHGAVGDDAGVVLYPGAIAQLLHHVYVVIRALLYALRLDELVVVGEILHAFVALCAYALYRRRHFLLGGDVVARGVDDGVREIALRRAGDDVYLAQAVDLVAKELHTYGAVIPVSGENLHRVAAHAEHIALKGDVVALIARLDELAQKLIHVPALSGAHGDRHIGEIIRLAQAVDTRHGGDDDNVPPLQKRKRRREAKAVDLIVDGAVLFNVRIRVRDVRLRLVIVVVGDEVFHGVFREKLLELAAQLGREGLVVCEDKRGAVEPRDDVRHGERLARARHAEQHLFVQPVLYPADKRVYRLRLVAGGSIL